MNDSIRFAFKLTHESKWTFRVARSSETIDSAMSDSRNGDFVSVRDRYYAFYGYGVDCAYTAIAVVDAEGDFEDISQEDVDKFGAIPENSMRYMDMQ
jgi:hypothetical protein